MLPCCFHSSESGTLPNHLTLQIKDSLNDHHHQNRNKTSQTYLSKKSLLLFTMAPPALHKRKLHIFQEFYTVESNHRYTATVTPPQYIGFNSCTTNPASNSAIFMHCPSFFLNFFFSNYLLSFLHCESLVNFLLIISSPNWNEFFSTVSHSRTLCTFLAFRFYSSELPRWFHFSVEQSIHF